MARKCEELKKNGNPCGANAMVGKNHCYPHRPKELVTKGEGVEPSPVGPSLGEPSPVAAPILSLEDTLEAMAEDIENLKGRMGRVEKKSDSGVERQDVMEGRLDVFHKMLEEDAKIQRKWKPIPRERYPAPFANDPNNKWVMLTPIQDGEVTVRGKGVVFTVPFKRGITMGTFTAFVQDARNKGIIP